MDDFLENLFKRQLSYKVPEPSPITQKNRLVIVEWMGDVIKKFRSPRVVLYSSVNLLDRSIYVLHATTKNLQLIACACMLIVSKLEEIYFSEVGDFVYVADKSFTRAELINMEREIIAGLKFYINPPTCYHFYVVYMSFITEPVSDKQRECAEKYLSGSILFNCLLKYAPSEIAAGAVYISLYNNNNPLFKWSDSMARITRLTECEVRDGVVTDLLNNCFP